MTDEVTLAYTSREDECLKAAMKLLEKSIENMPIEGWTGTATDPRVAGRALLAEVAHGKYVECTSTPRVDTGKGPASR